MARYLNQRQFAELCGITQQAVSRAIKSQRLNVTAHGIDPNDPRNEYFRDQALDKKPINAPILPSNRVPPGPKPNGRRRRKADTSTPAPEIEPSQLDLDSLSKKYEIDAAKSREMTRKYKIENEQKRGELINRNTVKQFLSKLYSIETSEFHTIGDRLGPELASLAGIEDPGLVLQFEKAIKKEVSKTLDHIENEIDGYLRGLAEGAAT